MTSDKWQVRGKVLLTQLDPTDWMGEKRGKIERERKEERERRNSRERGFTFSLDFPLISPSNFDETKGKVDPHCKIYTWVPEMWSFDKLREVGVFSYLDIPCLKSHENGFGCCEAEKGHAFRFQGSGAEA